MADQKINALPTKTSPTSGDKVLMSGAAEEYLIDYDQLATAILNKLTSKTYTLDQGTKTLVAALNELNSNIKSGYVTTGEDGSASVLFDQSFGSAPRIICQLLGTSDRIIICKTTGITSTGFTVKCLEKTDAGNSAVSGAVLHWIAVRP